jgi:GH25 family lysozyme M1 (1,4-beta-N-acetylmuramidase)
VNQNFRYFVDLSSNNAHDGAASFNAREYAAAGHTLVGIKVSQGVDYVNPYWETWTEAAHAARVSVLLYHFADVQGGDGATGGVAQARYFEAAIKKSGAFKPKYDSLCLDAEQGGLLRDAVNFRVGFESILTGPVGLVKPSAFIVYSDIGYFEQFGQGLVPKSGKLWEAAYPDVEPGWWTKYDWAHQYTQSAAVKGVQGLVDLSQMKLSAAVWHRIHRP